MGYIAAVRDALTQAGAPEDAFMTEVTKSDQSETYDDFDVIVVGGGASGTTAAAQATAQGAKVLLIEKSARIGGCGSMSTGVHVVDSRLQVEAGIANDNETYFPEAMSQGLWYPKGVIMKQFLDNGGKAMDFLIDTGGFEFAANPTGLAYAKDSIIEPNAAESWQRVANTVDTVLLETQVTSLLTDESGSVVGVEAMRYDGTSISAHAPAVVVATGGFMNNPELQQQYNHGVFSTEFALWQDKGECLQMMWDLGAPAYHVGGMNIHITQPPLEIQGVDDYTAMIPYTLHAAPNLLHVNDRGERFCSENMLAENMVANGNYIAAQGGKFYAIVSQHQMDVLASEGLAGMGLTAPVFWRELQLLYASN